MVALLFAVGFVALAALAPWLGTDSTDARAEGTHTHRTVWPAYPLTEPDAPAVSWRIATK